MMRSILGALVLVALTLGCAADQRKTEKSLDDPARVNGATAEGDIRVLQSEKAHVVGQIVDGATAVVPAGIVVGILTGHRGHQGPGGHRRVQRADRRPHRTDPTGLDGSRTRPRYEPAARRTASTMGPMTSSLTSAW